jgi:hypothetical protein
VALPWLLGASVVIVSSLLAAPAMARGDAPVVVAYVAPPECASLDAFQVLVSTEIARRPAADRTWRWSVRVREEQGLYEGTVTSEDVARTVSSASCDDVTAALARVIADGEAGPLPLPPPLPAPPPAPPPPPPPPPREEPIVVTAVPPPAQAADKDTRPPSRAEWRIGGRADFSNHGFNATSYGSPTGAATVTGGMATLSLEVPGGFRKMEVELGVGRLGNTGNSPLTYTVVDTQTCLVDVPFGSTGLSGLGCLRLAFAEFSSFAAFDGVTMPQSGGALWAGAGARLQWQARVGLFVEASLTGMYGTVSAGESTSPGWLDAGIGAGFRL